jgi:hypothetical protein
MLGRGSQGVVGGGSTPPDTAAGRAEALAAALDADDYDGARRLLHEDCRYHAQGRTLRGRDAVLSEFAAISQWGRDNLDRLTFTHAIDGGNDQGATIRFYDELERSGRSIRHESIMRVEFGMDGSITALFLEENPAERQKVSEFLHAVGLRRPQ